MKKYNKPEIRIICTETDCICGASLLGIGDPLNNPNAEANRRGRLYGNDSNNYDEDFYFFDEN